MKKKHLPMTNMENMKNLEKLKEKEFTERAEIIQDTISLLKKLACVLAVINNCGCKPRCLRRG